MQRRLTADERIPGADSDPGERCRQIENESLPSSIGALLDEAATEAPDRLAWRFIDSGETMTYGELRRAVARLADSLQRIGVCKGAHVGVMLPNVPQFPITWLALSRLGAVMVPINIGYTGRELDYVATDAQIKFLVIQDAFLPVLDAMLKRPVALTDARVVVVGNPRPGQRDWAELDRAGDPAFRATAVIEPGHLMNIQYTSGTTGFPKGCMLTHRYWLTTGKINARRDGVRYERILISTPFYYMDPQWLLLMAFYQRGTVFVALKQSASRFVSWLHDYGIHFCLMPEAVFKQPPSPLDTDNQVRRANIYGVRPDAHAALEQRFNLNAREAFGMTEIGSTLFMPLEADDRVGSGSCGMPGPFRECRVVDAEGKPVPRGEIGELIVRGPGILLGYWNKPEATREAFYGEWFRTGDLFRQDEAGYFHIVGRIKDMIRRSSENIPAREVEAVMRGLPQVVEAAALPVPDPLRKEEVKIYLILQPGLTQGDLPPETVIAHAERYLAKFKVPRYVAYCSDFPRTPSGKIRKQVMIAETPDLRLGSWDRVDGLWR